MTTDDGNTATMMRSASILLFNSNTVNILMSRREVLEQFFSDVSKCLTASDFAEKSNTTSTPSFIDVDVDVECPKSEMVEMIVDVDVECPKSEMVEIIITQDENGDVQKVGEGDYQVEAPGTPDTYFSKPNSDDEYDNQHLSPVQRRSLIRDPTDLTDENSMSDMPPSAIDECNIEKTKMVDESDIQYCGPSLVHESEKSGIPVECPICLEEYVEGVFVIESKHCSHIFHKSCILLWLEKNAECPCCRKSMITDEEIQATISRSCYDTANV
eukprot:CAMPEP_0198253384 /NCGR_PEP_ID=MMETSP1447-20131203/3829_1 /TAXON_ID=420782 /ORGANISM="Chaetoceros dichaeta, Strain CCMP1751" /LENGTH=270 /DNA_ID=CAMNT_0043939047 /DNA_START=152 /DNA_END=964 /DNA_ORIENTATION=+